MCPTTDTPDIANEGNFRANVNGRSYTVSNTGQIVSGPPANVGKWIAPTQLKQLQQTGDYHGHLILADTQEDIPLAEAELELIVASSYAPLDAVREAALFNYKGVSGRIEEMLEDGTATVNLGGLVRPMPVNELVIEAAFLHGSQFEDSVELTESELDALDEAAKDSSGNDDPNGDSTEMLESKTDEVLIAEAQARLDIVRKRKES